MGNSLSGKNGQRKGCAGVGSSPTSPTKHRLWKRLQKLDRRMAKLDNAMNITYWTNKSVYNKQFTEWKRRDAERCKVRAELKGHIPSSSHQD